MQTEKSIFYEADTNVVTDRVEVKIYFQWVFADGFVLGLRVVNTEDYYYE
jgi:hypothetical protein